MSDPISDLAHYARQSLKSVRMVAVVAGKWKGVQGRIVDSSNGYFRVQVYSIIASDGFQLKVYSVNSRERDHEHVAVRKSDFVELGIVDLFRAHSLCTKSVTAAATADSTATAVAEAARVRRQAHVVSPQPRVRPNKHTRQSVQRGSVQRRLCPRAYYKQSRRQYRRNGDHFIGSRTGSHPLLSLARLQVKEALAPANLIHSTISVDALMSRSERAKIPVVAAFSPATAHASVSSTSHSRSYTSSSASSDVTPMPPASNASSRVISSPPMYSKFDRPLLPFHHQCFSSSFRSTKFSRLRLAFPQQNV